MATVLIVGDTPNSRELLRTVLEQLGHAVIDAADGKGALRHLQTQTPDLIILDLQIPPPNGYDVLRVIRSNIRTAAIPVIAVTAHAMKGDSERALAIGFSRYLAKPVSLTELRSEVQRLLQERYHQSEDPMNPQIDPAK